MNANRKVICFSEKYQVFTLKNVGDKNQETFKKVTTTSYQNFKGFVKHLKSKYKEKEFTILFLKKAFVLYYFKKKKLGLCCSGFFNFKN